MLDPGCQVTQGSGEESSTVLGSLERASREREMDGFGEKEGRQFVSVAELKSQGQRAGGF